MESPTPTAPASTTMLWAGRILGGLVILFMLFDGVIKVMNLPAAVEGTVRVGYPARLVVTIGVVALACTILYAVPRTSILGAILLTGYLGGATATQVRMEDPWFLFPVAIGGLVWAAIFLRDNRLRTLIPLRR
jgi:hypothetical protein